MVRPVGRFNKTPDERKKYTIDYEDWLDPTETLESVTFEVSFPPLEPDTPLVIEEVVLSVDAMSVSFFAEAGYPGVTYEVIADAVTSHGQLKQDAVIFQVLG